MSSAHGENNIFAETGMGKPKAAKPMVHHPHHPGGIKANAMTAAQYEAKLGKDPKGKLLPKGVGYKVANGVSQSLYYKAEEQQARNAYLARHPRQAKIQAQAAAKDKVQVKVGDKKQSLYYKAEEQQARDTYLARHPRQAKIQAQNKEAAAKDKAQVKAFDAKVARDLSELNQMEAMAETVNFIDGPEGRAQGNQVKVAGMFDDLDKGARASKSSVAKTPSLHYVSGAAGAAQVAGMFDEISEGEHGHGALRTRARGPDPKLTPVKGLFSSESR